MFDSDLIFFARSLIIFPYFGPSSLKLGLSSLISKEFLLSRNSIDFTFISDKICDFASSISFFSISFFTGIIILFNGCLTFIFSFFLIERAREQIFLT